MKPKRRVVALITHNDRGGAQEALARLCDGLERLGHDVELWYLYRCNPPFLPNVRSREVLPITHPSAWGYLKIAINLICQLKAHQPDCVISFLPLANVLGQTLAWCVGIPVRIASQRNPVTSYGQILRALDWYFGTCGSYTNNVVNSSDVRDSTSNYPQPYKSRLSIIYNGIEGSPSQIDRSMARAKWQIAESQTALVAVGRLTEQKNHVFLVHLLTALPNFRLIIAGTGALASQIGLEADRMDVAERVTLLGNINKASVKEIMTAGDIFVMPSIYEGQSNALLEAMNIGMPIVATDIGANRETLVRGQVAAGILLPLTEPDRWISALKYLREYPKYRESLGEVARIRAKDFSTEAMCNSFEAVMFSSKW